MRLIHRAGLATPAIFLNSPYQEKNSLTISLNSELPNVTVTSMEFSKIQTSVHFNRSPDTYRSVAPWEKHSQSKDTKYRTTERTSNRKHNRNHCSGQSRWHICNSCNNRSQDKDCKQGKQSSYLCFWVKRQNPSQGNEVRNLHLGESQRNLLR